MFGSHWPGRANLRWGFAVALSAVLIVTLANAAPAQAAPPKPPNPSDQQIKSAQAQKDAAARDVGMISARIAVAQARLDRLNSDAQLAEQKLALALQRERDAKDAAASARNAVSAAQSKVDQAHRQFVEYVQQTYMSGSLGGTTGVLLTAGDPSALMEQGTLQQYVSAHQIDAMGQLNRATVIKSNADAAARSALQKQTQAAAAAATAQQNVLAALSQATSAKAGLDAQLTADRQQLQTAQIALTGITNQRAAYLAWQKQQAEIAAREAERKRQTQLRQQQAAAAAAARLRNQQPSGGGSSHGGGGGGGSPAPSPSGGSWSAAKGQRAVDRAMRYLGMRYSWAAGNASGPTYGVSEPGNAWNDSNVLGFDCSGLTLYAWAPYLRMDHYAATQYTQAGNYHPSIDNLMPGDLVFWSGDGTIGGIGHEAMYIGGGNVIQAPQSGDVIKITNVYNVESGYFGATRPLT